MYWLNLEEADIDLSCNEIHVRNGKGAKDRATMLPEAVNFPLQEHLKKVKTIHVRDSTEEWGRVRTPTALERKYPMLHLNGAGKRSFQRRTAGQMP